MHSCTIRFTFNKEGHLVPENTRDKNILREFQQAVGTETVGAFMSIERGNASLDQLAKIHAMIRDVSLYTGHSFDDVKKEVKRRCGLTFEVKDETFFRSFADISKEEMSNCITGCIELGESIGCFLDKQWDK